MAKYYAGSCSTTVRLLKIQIRTGQSCLEHIFQRWGGSYRKEWTTRQTGFVFEYDERRGRGRGIRIVKKGGGVRLAKPSFNWEMVSCEYFCAKFFSLQLCKRFATIHFLLLFLFSVLLLLCLRDYENEAQCFFCRQRCEAGARQMNVKQKERHVVLMRKMAGVVDG